MVDMVLTGDEHPEPEPVRNLEFLEDNRQVSHYGPVGNIEPARDFLIARPRTDQEGDLTFPGCQILEINFRQGRARKMILGAEIKRPATGMVEM